MAIQLFTDSLQRIIPYVIILFLLVYISFLKRKNLRYVWRYRKENINFYILVSMACLFVLFFILYNILSSSYSEEAKGNYIQVTLGVVGFMWAIFTGYFAFIQILENRKEKLISEAKNHLMQKNKEYQSAITKLERVYRIDPKDKASIFNLSELYSITNSNEEAKIFAGYASKLIETEFDALVCHYLIILSKIKSINQISKPMEEMIKFIKNNPKADMSVWNFNDLYHSNFYTQELTKEQKELLSKTILLLTKKITSESFIVYCNSISLSVKFQ